MRIVVFFAHDPIILPRCFVALCEKGRVSLIAFSFPVCSSNNFLIQHIFIWHTGSLGGTEGDNMVGTHVLEIEVAENIEVVVAFT